MAKWLKKNWITLILIAVVLAGVCLLVYPTFSDWWNSLRQSQAIASYVETVEGLSPEEAQELMDAAKAYNEQLWKKENRLILSPEEDKEYRSLLDVTGTGIIGTVHIPSVGIDLPIYHGTDEAVLQIASGHIPGTSFPIGGEGTHAVISGHRGLPSARLFTDLDQLAEGDVFTVTVLNQAFTYQIDKISTVLPEDTTEIALLEKGDYCTLQTCTPYGVNTHRLLLRGKRIPNPEAADIVPTVEAVRVPNYLVVPAVGVPLLVVLLVIVLISRRRKHPKLTEEDMKRPIHKD